MMKLRYLFDNRPLAEMILSHWDYNPERMDLLNDYRISANAIYPFEMDGSTHFLRFTAEEETDAVKIRAELEFLHYLRKEGYPTTSTVLSRRGNEVEPIDTPWGRYYAVVFKGVSGERVDRIHLSAELIHDLGKALGRLHRLSSHYSGNSYRRKDWRHHLQWIEEVLSGFPHEKAAKEEVRLLEEFFTTLSVTGDNFGLIHYDFEPDNIFFDETTGTFHVIDFDDAHYHWFVMDIEQAMDSLREEMDLPESEDQRMMEEFIRGYRQEMPLYEEMLALMPIFRRYANLYGYVRILRAVSEKFMNEPEWMVNLRGHLDVLMEERSRFFGQPVSW